MTRRQRLIRLLVLVSVAVAVSASAADRTHRAVDKTSAKKNQASPSALPAPPGTPTTAAPGGTPTTTGTSAPLFKLDWYSINGGGAIDASSASYKMGLSVGQSVAGEASSASYKMGIGFWYGAGGCSCPSQGDVNGDAAIDVFDIIETINRAFSGAPAVQDPGCPTERADVNNDGAADVFDLIYLIATAFSGGAMPVNPCG
jgi:hypothetical protein